MTQRASGADTCDNCIAARDGTSAFAEADMTAAARQVVDGVHALNSRDVLQDLEAADAFCKVPDLRSVLLWSTGHLDKAPSHVARHSSDVLAV